MQQFPETRQFTVLEGLDGVGKSTTAAAFSKLSGAIVMHTPDQRLNDVRPIFDSASLTTRDAFYNAANHLVSDQVREAIKSADVVVDRYAPSTIAAAYAHGLIDSEDILDTNQDRLWDDGLLIPDMVVHLHLDESERVRRMTSRGQDLNRDEKLLMNNNAFRSRYLEALDSLATDVVIIDSMQPEAIGEKLLDLLRNRRV